MLPPGMNELYDGPGDPRLSGALLHGKFLPQIVAKSDEELQRRQHFADPDAYAGYHRALCAAPVLKGPASVRYEGPGQLLRLGLVGAGEWLTPGACDA